ncbi:unnamed protein product [Prorocentrum cordatum]|uniref:Uncharacterized protein n=1 Tax=Prorocentrum cordatum TaxID=2364126 RepID=A0ABN9RRU0_9DINO|nr:unnamed protein product [Polarella glacialis]
MECCAGPCSEDPGRDQLRHVGDQSQPPIDSPPQQDRNDPVIQAFTKIPPSIQFVRCTKSAGDRRLPANPAVPRVGYVQNAGVVAENRPGLVQRSVEVEDAAVCRPRAPGPPGPKRVKKGARLLTASPPFQESSCRATCPSALWGTQRSLEIWPSPAASNPKGLETEPAPRPPRKRRTSLAKYPLARRT